MFDRGCITLARFRGVSVRLHFTFPLGVAIFTASQGIAPGAWLAFVVVAIAHALGHVLAARGAGLPVERVTFHVLGADCAVSGPQRPLARSGLAAGALMAQALVAGLTEVYVGMRGWPEGAFLLAFTRTLVWSNFVLLAVNLIPFAPFDGAEVWKLPFRLRRPKSVVVMAPPARPQMSTRGMPGARPLPRPVRTTPSQPMAVLERGTSTSSAPPPSSVVYDSEERLPRETEEYLRAVLERARKNSQPKN